MSPFNSFLFLQGIETLGMRMDRHVSNTLAVAKYLEQHTLIEWVRYPSLPSSPYYADWRRSMFPKAQARSSRSASRAATRQASSFIDNLKIFSHLANVGDARSLVIHPASTTHQQLTADQQRAAGVEPEMVRFSVGLEDLDDHHLGHRPGARVQSSRRNYFVAHVIWPLIAGSYCGAGFLACRRLSAGALRVLRRNCSNRIRNKVTDLALLPACPHRSRHSPDQIRPKFFPILHVRLPAQLRMFDHHLLDQERWNLAPGIETLHHGHTSGLALGRRRGGQPGRPVGLEIPASKKLRLKALHQIA